MRLEVIPARPRVDQSTVIDCEPLDVTLGHIDGIKTVSTGARRGRRSSYRYPHIKLLVTCRSSLSVRITLHCVAPVCRHMITPGSTRLPPKTRSSSYAAARRHAAYIDCGVSRGSPLKAFLAKMTRKMQDSSRHGLARWTLQATMVDLS